MASWTDRYWNSADGVKLHYRDYAGNRDRPPILCIPGLTRNARDFEPVADRYAGDWRVISIDLRGRGGSAFDPDPANYKPMVYVADILKMLDQLGIADAVFVGTSLGGICTMALALGDRERIAGALLNDIGPEIDRAGVERIAGWVGKEARFANWDEAIDKIMARNGDIYPDYSRAEWERFVRRIAREDGASIIFDYDLAIAGNFESAASAPDVWPLYQALDGRPVTILRGELSDLLGAKVAERMATELADVELVTVPRVGHTPTFDEPESIAALDRLLDRVLEAQKKGQP
ncbi:alpha/beta hydrolase [Sphingomonas sp.]|uniref:alpha/beta fold hydrolase n=1 Tax=Sphingomonas sp. TaxID=28214 RepID=UPI00286BCB1D|nr:alpha/beta hydrolase [Sphingomonas sp.]